MPRPPNFNEADVSDKPQVIRRRPLMNARRIAAVQEMWQQRRETPDVGRRGDRLDRRDAAPDRRARRHADHLHLRQRLLPRRAPGPERQGDVYEPSIHLPLMMRWTGNTALPRGVHRSQLSERRRRRDDRRRGERHAGPRHGRHLATAALARQDQELGRDLLIDNSPGAGHFDGIRRATTCTPSTSAGSASSTTSARIRRSSRASTTILPTRRSSRRCRRGCTTSSRAQAQAAVLARRRASRRRGMGVAGT